MIVCLGATPAHRLTGRSDGILKMRGKWVTINISGRNIPLLPLCIRPICYVSQPRSGWPGVTFFHFGKYWMHIDLVHTTTCGL